jgi:hypothetical protein
MRFITKSKALVAAAALTLGLTACSTTTALSDILSTTQGQSFLAALGATGSLLPGIQNVISAIDGGLSGAATQDALNTVCYALPWADGALDLFGPVAGVNSAIVSSTDAAVSAFEAGVCKNPPTTLAQAIQDGAQIFVNIENQLKGVGVPVTVPVSTSMTARHL